jgi:calcium binding protein 39
LVVLTLQVFVANPKKPDRILDLLVRNKDKLIEYLSDFHSDRGEDEQFMEERAYLIRQIQSL